MHKTKNLVRKIGATGALALSAVAPKALAAVSIPTIAPAGGELNLGTLVQSVISWILWGAGVIAFGYLLYGGILFVIAQGDSEKVKKARNTVLYAVIGIIVIVLALAIMRFAVGLGSGGGIQGPPTN